MRSDRIRMVGPLNLSTEEADALLGELGGVVEHYEVNDHPKAETLGRVERKLQAAIVVDDQYYNTDTDRP